VYNFGRAALLLLVEV